MKYIILIPSYEPDYKLVELVKSIDKDIDIIVINDGSGKKYKEIYEEVKKCSHLISYDDNMGKGYALKKGYEYIKSKYDEYAVVTMDSDGQHIFSDALKLLHYIEKHPKSLAIGRRSWDSSTPKRSRIGNYLTRKYYKRVTEIEIYDTQSGLRCFSNELMDYMINIDGNGYEYEMNVLLGLKNNNIPVHEIDIETIYINNNKDSHFKFISDSYKIYKVINESKYKQKTKRNRIKLIIDIVCAIIFLLIVIYCIIFKILK